MTTPAAHRHQDPPAAPDPDTPLLVRLAHAVEGAEGLDGAVAALKPLAERLHELPGSADLLRGRPLGHALHPLLTDAPLGAWMSAGLLDLLAWRRSRDAARFLTGFGVLSAVPTALTGLAEWGHTEGRDARTGVAHAAGNAVGLLLFSASWLARRRGHHGRGAVLSTLALGAAAGSGFLGAHLAIARNVGSRHRSFADSEPVAAPGAGHVPDPVT